MRTRILLVAVAILAVGLAGPALAQPKDIVDTAVAAGSFKTLAKLLTDADLIGVMKGPGPYTVFAPTDDAFAKVPADVLAGLAKDKAKLQEVLKYHVLTPSGRPTTSSSSSRPAPCRASPSSSPAAAPA
jgi:uncharacterized surface protein with fasciclin (FAS1) repeats